MQVTKKIISGWGRYPVKKCNAIEPSYPLETLEECSGFKRITPRGLGRSYGDSSLGPEDSLVIETTSLKKFLSFDKKSGRIKVYAGVSLENILDVIIPHGYFLPVVPGTRFITMGGAIASNVHGKNHHHCGAISNFITEFSILTENGEIICTPENNPLLFRATCGGLGMTGLIQSAEVKLKKIETPLISTRLIKVRNFQEALELSKKHDRDYEYSVTWIDCLAKGKNLGRGIVMLGNHTPLSECLDNQLLNSQVAFPASGFGVRPKIKVKKILTNEDSPQLAAGSFNKWKLHFSIPDIFPSWALNPLTIKLFNFAYYNKQIKRECTGHTSFESFFFPLDLISNWNIMYGKKGFVQYQFAIPFQNGEKGIQTVLEYLSNKQIGSFLAVLKIVREDNCMLPFAIPGFTLALDIPLSHKEIFEFLDELDTLVLQFGGRLYMTKDSRLSPGTFRKMYPEYETWLDAVSKFSPNKKFYTLQAERLRL